MNNEVTILPEPTKSPEVIKFSVTDAAIETLKAYKDLAIKNGTDKEGFNKVVAARKEVKRTRVALVDEAKKKREAATAYSKRVIAEEARIVSELVLIEADLQDKEDAYELIQQQKRDELARQKKEKYNGRVKTLLDMGLAFDGQSFSVSDTAIDNFEVETYSDSQFDQFAKEAGAAMESLTAQLAELQRQKDEEAETERLRLEAKRIADEAAAELLRLAQAEVEKERLRLEGIRLEQEAREKKLKDAEDEAERLRLQALADKKKADEGAQRLVDLENARLQGIEDARLKAEKVAEDARLQKIIDDAAALAEAQRLEALRPDKDKLIAYAAMIGDMQPPVVESKEARAVLVKVADLLLKVETFINDKAEKL